jgi:alanine racemase
MQKTEIQYTLSEIANIIKGECINCKNQVINSLLIDSRKTISSENCLFFALVSKRNDGHNYISELYNKGFRNFVISSYPDDFGKYPEASFVYVKNTIKALQTLAANKRKRFNIPIIGITGSNGKTIVKEWLSQLMTEDYNLVKNPKSYNSQIGVPLSVWQIQAEHDFGIFEAGISEPDEMINLQQIIQPTIGVFTNIGHAHDENFIHRDQKIGEKLKLFTKVDTLIYCIDYLEIKERILKSEVFKSIPVFTWSKKYKADLAVNQIDKNSRKTYITAIYKEIEVSIEIPFTDDASIENAIHCCATLLHLGYNQEIISNRMKLLHPIAMRLELKEGINNCSIINDSYSSDFDSLNIAIDFLNQQKQHKKKTIILSDILQSGREENDLYSEISDLLQKKGISRIIGIGKAIKSQADKFKIEKSFYESTDSFIRDFLFSGFNKESILLKGARIFEFEKISNILQQKAHETILEINLNAIIHNLNFYRSTIQTETKIMAMVKAFSYGSGSYEIANALQFHNVDYLTVAYSDEGVELRKAGITLPIMVMNPDEQSIDSILKNNLEPEIYSLRIFQLLEKAIEQHITDENQKVKIHIKLDTGMHRLGFEINDLPELIHRIKKNPNIIVQSVFSHLAASDNNLYDVFTKKQISSFNEMSSFIISELGYNILRHILNSAGILRFPEAQYDMVRLGIGLYGISSIGYEQKDLQNVGTLKTVISQIKNIPENDTVGYGRAWIAAKNSKIAIIPIGYADGLNRKLGNGNGKVLINNRFAPIIGSICMDMCMVDISGIDANENDEVIIFGEKYSVNDIANDLQTIPYEVLTSISRRVKRIYFQE